MLIFIMRNMINDNMYIIPDLHTFLHSFKVTLDISISLLHSSTNLSINLCPTFTTFMI